MHKNHLVGETKRNGEGERTPGGTDTGQKVDKLGVPENHSRYHAMEGGTSMRINSRHMRSTGHEEDSVEFYSGTWGHRCDPDMMGARVEEMQELNRRVPRQGAPSGV